MFRTAISDITENSVSILYYASEYSRISDSDFGCSLFRVLDVTAI